MHAICKTLGDASKLANEMTNDSGVLLSLGVTPHGIEVRGAARVMNGIAFGHPISSAKLVPFADVEEANVNVLKLKLDAVLAEVKKARDDQ